MTRKYPLDPLKRVRTERVEQRALALSEAMRKVDRTRAETARRERAEAGIVQAQSTITLAEDERLAKGELVVADLARGAAWGVAADMERTALARAVDEARAEQSRAGIEAEKKRAGLLAAQAEAEVVCKNHQSWLTAERDQVMAKEEESAEEAHLARSRGRGRS